MKINRQYQGVQLSKKESELVTWLQKGEHTWSDAFYIYKDRRSVKISSSMLKERSWFNKTLSSLHRKGLCNNIPFIYNGLVWRNPGIESSKASFVAMSMTISKLITMHYSAICWQHYANSVGNFNKAFSPVDYRVKKTVVTGRIFCPVSMILLLNN